MSNQQDFPLLGIEWYKLLCEAYLKAEAYGYRAKRARRHQESPQATLRGYIDVVEADVPKHLDAASYCPLFFAVAEFRFGGPQIAQAIFPSRFPGASDEPVLWLDTSIKAFGQLRFVSRTLYFQPPLRRSCVVVGLELFDTEPQGFDRRRDTDLQRSIGPRPVCPAAPATPVLGAQTNSAFRWSVKQAANRSTIPVRFSTSRRNSPPASLVIAPPSNPTRTSRPPKG